MSRQLLEKLSVPPLRATFPLFLGSTALTYSTAHIVPLVIHLHVSLYNTHPSIVAVEYRSSTAMATAEMAQYVYEPLDESKDEIRLISLRPAADRDSKVICDLKIVQLTEEDVPRYEALSYTWGSTESPVRLVVSSIDDHIIDITTNLAEALTYLRDPVLPRVLWIDAIAINQKDLDERGQQVQRMADIFSLAERVVVWLGKDDANSKKVMDISQVLSMKVEIDSDGSETIRGLTDHADDAHWSNVREQLPYDIATWQSIIHFLRRPWFHRLWIWQEIGLAKPNAMTMCGADTMHWTHLRTLIACVIYKRSQIAFGVNSSEDIRIVVTMVYNLTRVMDGTLLELLANMRHTTCVDPRDRVYGILGLLSKNGPPIHIRPDYKKPVVDVYMDLMLYWMHISRDLGLLHLCRYDTNMQSWPSWIPCLMDLPKSNGIFSNASGSSMCDVELLEDRILSAKGMCLSQITMVDEFDTSHDTVHSGIQRWAKAVDTSYDYIDGKTTAEAFCLVICRGAVADCYMPPSKMHPTLRSSLAVVQDIVHSGERELVMDHNKKLFFGHVFDSCKDGVFFTTSSNHIGIGPVGTREGDQICVLLGGGAPMVIRADSHGRYKIIGGSYVSGFSSNEAFLGSLPRGYKEISRFDKERGGYYWVFHNLETGDIQVEDPRLSSELPTGWKRNTNRQGQVCEGFRHSSAPDSLTNCDPRLRSWELLKRGVPLEDIEFS